jgi:hypothetical protein
MATAARSTSSSSPREITTTEASPAMTRHLLVRGTAGSDW